MDSDKYFIYVLSQILGGSMGDCLFNILREENGLTYESGSSTEFYCLPQTVRLILIHS